VAIQNANSTFLVSEEPTRSREVVLTYMNWLYLFIAGLFEIAWAIGLKYTEGWTRLWPSLITAVLMIASFYFLSLAVRTLPIGTAYAIWTGIGTVGAAILGVILFDEPRDMLRVGCIFLIIAGIAGLKLSSS
jgi:quaternary ammonium compound-resistance protein SugE